MIRVLCLVTCDLYRPRQRDGLLRRLTHRVGRREVEAAFLEHPLPFVNVRAFHADDDGYRDAELLDGRDDALSQHVATQNAPEDVDEHRSNVLVGHQNLESVPNLLSVGSATDV